jgi:hypothetical protein
MASPLVFLNVATSAQSQAYTPVWMGPGMTNGLNPVADVGCPAVNGARFLSPSPSSTPSTLSTPIYGPPPGGTTRPGLPQLKWGQTPADEPTHRSG